MCRPVSLVLVGAALFAAAGPSPAQRDPDRPRLPRGADTNDWEAYFDFAVDIIRGQPNKADTAFYWASRLDPSRAEPLFGRWVAFWMRDLGRFRDYLDERPQVLESQAVRDAEAFNLRAQERNPFVPQTLWILPFDQLPGRWRETLYVRGWLAYARRDFAKAAEHFGREIDRDPERNVWVRYDRALAFVPLFLYDSAAVEMRELIATLRRRDTTITSPIYQSKEMVEYGIGLLALAQGDLVTARKAFERALEENLGFVPAHAMLADLALARRDSVIGVREYAQAVELAPDDAWLRHRYGAALLNLRRPREAAAELRTSIALEPFFADSYLVLARALELLGDREGTARALEDYLRRAPRRHAQQIPDAQRRLEALRAGTP
jgi:tetratricopeptide (TPR) repeat protein